MPQVQEAYITHVVRCSFCNKDQSDVARLITGHVGTTVAICNECVEVCNQIIAGKVDEEPRHTGLQCPSCGRDVVLIDDTQPPLIVTRCPSCGYLWKAEEPGNKH